MKENYNFKFFSNLLIFGIVFINIFTLANINKNDMWIDEAFTYSMIQKTYFNILTNPIDVHPPISYLIFKLFYELFGIIRYTSYIFYLLSIYLFYCVAKLYFNNNKNLYTSSTLIYAMSWSLLFHGIEFRMYPILMCFSLLSTYYYLKFALERDNYYKVTNKSFMYLLIMCMFLYLAVLTHYYSVFLIILFLSWNINNFRNLFFEFINKVFNGYYSILFYYGTGYLLFYIIGQLRFKGKLAVSSGTILSYPSALLYWFSKPINFTEGYSDWFSLIYFIILIFIIFLLLNLANNTETNYLLFIFGFLAVFIIFATKFSAWHPRYFLVYSIPMYLILGKMGIYKYRKYIFLSLLFISLTFSVIMGYIDKDTELQKISKFIVKNSTKPILINHESLMSYLPMRYYLPNTENLLYGKEKSELIRQGASVINEKYFKDYPVGVWECNKNIDEYYLDGGNDNKINNMEIVLNLDGISIKKVKC